MATALAAVRLQRPQQPDGVDAVHRYMEVVHGMRDLGTSRVHVRALAAFGKRVSSESRESVCRVPLFRTSSPRREALVSAMGEGEYDITDMQETDKVSGEWWKNVLTAVQDWSSDKLLGLAELADGSLFFSFGGSESARPAAKTSRAQTETKVNGSTHNTTPVTRPSRQPSSFRKHSPIPASRKKSATVSTQAPATGQEDKKTQKASSPSKSARPQRPPSAFSKRSPIPKDRVRVPASTSEKKTPPEVPPVAETPTSTPAFDSQTDSPFSPELKEILNHGKETQSEDTVESKTDSKASSAAPAKKKPKEILNHGKETQSEEETAESKTDAKTPNPAPAKKKPSKPATEEFKPATEESEVAQNGAATEDLGSYKLPELRSLAKARGLKGYSKLKKGELVELLATSQP